MPIFINHRTTRVQPPNITLTGQRVRHARGTYNADQDTEAVHTDKVRVSGTDVRTRTRLDFRGRVRVRITPDDNWPSRTYNRRVLGDVVGRAVQDNSHFGQRSETYYTLNGKDPVRTKANLYTGRFDIYRNGPGSGTIVLKARTYCQGYVSEVRTVEIKIIPKDISAFQ
jgi:hypothetical protein